MGTVFSIQDKTTVNHVLLTANTARIIPDNVLNAVMDLIKLTASIVSRILIQQIAQKAVRRIAQKEVTQIAQKAVRRIAQKEVTQIAQKAVRRIAQKEVPQIAQKAVLQIVHKVKTLLVRLDSIILETTIVSAAQNFVFNV